ncbi:helix-turn-helix transcriptional regulator [Streptomyces sp. SRF1]|uniref:helix-turn-helix domain-containing protein n=1 Tax=Streptomyces sp. SRF1 TaxID=1549642 RepID=UPI0025AEDBFA|nr:helix-turn-helix transcriptional regulator [Streptomyces sp. SRF1]MDN3057426.1 helix-turn-helix transcriptional regulator [Streptomyces sp. SRF1]
MRRHRRDRGMSAQQLADRCAELGLDSLPRTVISNLENGRRGNITVAEVLVLAEALGVPAAALIFPVGYETDVEHLPGKTSGPLAAVDRLVGETAPEESALSLMRAHRALEARIRAHYRRIWEQAIDEYQWGGEPGGPEAEAARTVAAELTEQLHELREEIARRGLLLPPLAGLDRPTVPDGESGATTQ